MYSAVLTNIFVAGVVAHSKQVSDVTFTSFIHARPSSDFWFRFPDQANQTLLSSIDDMWIGIWKRENIGMSIGWPSQVSV